MFAMKFFVLIVFEFCSIVLTFFDSQKLLNLIFSSFESIVTTFIFFFFLLFSSLLTIVIFFVAFVSAFVLITFTSFSSMLIVLVRSFVASISITFAIFVVFFVAIEFVVLVFTFVLITLTSFSTILIVFVRSFIASIWTAFAIISIVVIIAFITSLMMKINILRTKKKVCEFCESKTDFRNQKSILRRIADFYEKKWLNDRKFFRKR